MGSLVGGLIIALSWLGGIGFWLWAFIFLFIVQLHDGLTAIPMDGSAIFWGIAWFFLAKIIAGFIIWLGTIVGGIVVATTR